MDKTRYDVFISYSHKDYVDGQKNVIPGNEISRIRESLTNAGITFWMDERGIVPGEDFAAKILKHIKVCKVFLFLSSVSANQSEWTRREIACALMYKKHIIPVLLDDSPFDDSVMMRIVNLDRIDYYKNPQQGVTKLIRSVNTYLEMDKADEARRMAEEKRRQEELECQRRKQEEEIKRQEQMAKVESRLDALEAQMIELKKAVLQAQVDLNACEDKIIILQKKLQELSKSKKKEGEVNHVFTVEGVSFKMFRVEGGSFMMGSPNNDLNAYDDERPQHKVTLSDYYIGETQVTQALWKEVMGKNPSRFKGGNNPVERVSWDDCQEFIKQLNTRTGRTFRLPTEAEWEYAARGGNKSRGYKYAGGDNSDEVAWYGDNSEGKTHPVKQKKANELGLYDMSGNVWEWCQDWFARYDSDKETNPTGPSEGSGRVLRGGSLDDDARCCRVVYRGFLDPVARDYFIGFRLALVQQ